MDVVGVDGTQSADSHQLLRRKLHLLPVVAGCVFVHGSETEFDNSKDWDYRK